MLDTRPNMRQRALFVTSNAACRWNKIVEGVLGRSRFERHREREIDRAVKCRGKGYQSRRIAFIRIGISAFADDGKVQLGGLLAQISSRF